MDRSPCTVHLLGHAQRGYAPRLPAGAVGGSTPKPPVHLLFASASGWPRGRPGLTLDLGLVHFFPGPGGWRSEGKRCASACSARLSAQSEGFACGAPRRLLCPGSTSRPGRQVLRSWREPAVEKIGYQWNAELAGKAARIGLQRSVPVLFCLHACVCGR